MCNCSTHARDLSETQGGKYPAANHAPTCEDYKKECYIRVEHDGSWCLMEPHDAADMIFGADEEYSVEAVYITRDQFEKLPEFEGF